MSKLPLELSLQTYISPKIKTTEFCRCIATMRSSSSMAIFQSSILAIIKEHLFVTIFETIFGLFKALTYLSLMGTLK